LAARFAAPAGFAVLTTAIFALRTGRGVSKLTGCATLLAFFNCLGANSLNSIPITTSSVVQCNPPASLDPHGHEASLEPRAGAAARSVESVNLVSRRQHNVKRSLRIANQRGAFIRFRNRVNARVSTADGGSCFEEHGRISACRTLESGLAGDRNSRRGA
jgi:hypothetical protein